MKIQNLNLLEAGDVPRIVVIEDDGAVQSLISESMNKVVDAVELFHFTGAQKAIHDLWEQSADTVEPINILFLDIFLEGEVTGLDVLDYTKYLTSDVAVILMSSDFTSQQLEKIAELPTPPILLRKPFDSECVVQLSRWILSRQFGVLQ